MTSLKHKEYVRPKLSDTPDDVVDHYNLKKKSTKDGYIFIANQHGIYRLPQSGLLAQPLIEERLGKRVY